MSAICLIAFQECCQYQQPLCVTFYGPYLLSEPQPAFWIWDECLTNMNPFMDKMRRLVFDHASCRLQEVHEVQSSASQSFGHASSWK